MHSIGLVGFCHAAYFENKLDSIVAAKSDDPEQWVKRITSQMETVLS
jgi:hypothetical protein